MQEETKQAPVETKSTRSAATEKPEAKRHKMHKNVPIFTMDGLVHTFSDNVVNEFGRRGCAVSIEKKKNIRLHLGLIYASMWIDYVKDAAIHAMARSTGKTAIISVKDVEKAILTGKGRKVVLGLMDEKKEKKRKQEILAKKAANEKKKRERDEGNTGVEKPKAPKRVMTEEEEEEDEPRPPKRARTVGNIQTPPASPASPALRVVEEETVDA